MKYIKILVLMYVICGFMAVTGMAKDPSVHTYSIVAIDEKLGQMGVAVQSHWFSVGSVVTWAEAGVGAVATQSFAELSYGPLGLQLMKSGKNAPDALKALIAIDKNPDVRQVAMIDAKGNIAVHTGKLCIPEAGQKIGKNYSAQANLMLKNTVWDAMGNAFESTKGELADRLIAALEAAQNESGDIRGMQSAAILIVSTKSAGTPWAEKIVDLRVDDHAKPLEELKRLLNVQRAYDHMNKGDEYFSQKKMEQANKEYQTAEELAPDNYEIKFWHAVTLANTGKVAEALPIFKKVFASDKNWATLLPRLPKANLLPHDDTLIKKILSVSK